MNADAAALAVVIRALDYAEPYMSEETSLEFRGALDSFKADLEAARKADLNWSSRRAA